MVKQVSQTPQIYSIDVPLPDNPLKNLNCYVVRSGDETLVIDTGFRRPECATELARGLRELDVDLAKTKLFLTHLHSDHTGLIGEFIANGCEILMSAREWQLINLLAEHGGLAPLGEEGFPVEELRQQYEKNPAITYAPDEIIVSTEVSDGFTFPLGTLTFTCVHTPGHTPGHTCLYLKDEQIFFLGDHVLFDITPNITAWPGVDDSLRDYLNSLDKVAKFPIKLALPAHRGNDMDVYQRIADIKAHHAQRLQNTIDIVAAKPGLTAYDIAGGMKWQMRGKDWTEFPVQQKWFATGETIAHLTYLCNDGTIEKTKEDGLYRYRLV